GSRRDDCYSHHTLRSLFPPPCDRAHVRHGGVAMSRWLAAAVLGVAAVGFGTAQPPANTPTLRFKWQPGQTLTYKVVQQTAVTETTLDEKTEKPITSEARTNLTLTRKWTVKDVDPAGTATLEMAITELKNDIRQPDGSSIVRDSANPEHAK